MKCNSCYNCLSDTYENGNSYPKSAYTFTVCTSCGNKRCPKATDHTLECTNSNEPNQKGSRYGGLSDAGDMMSDKGYSLGNEADQKAFSDARNYPLPNIKINDLAEHCDFYVGNEHYDKTHEQQQRLFMEKFAELFLLQSIEVMKQHDYHGEWLGDKLKEYWGIDNGK
jgi:hypothetical protein